MNFVFNNYSLSYALYIHDLYHNSLTPELGHQGCLITLSDM